MRTRRTRHQLPLLVAAGLLTVAFSVSGAPSATHAAVPPTPPLTAAKPAVIDPPARPATTARSNDAAGAAPSATGGVVVEASLDRRADAAAGPTTVEIVTTTPTAEEQLQAVGASAISTVSGITLASLTSAQIRKIATEAGVAAVRTPVIIATSPLSSPSPEVGNEGSENSLPNDWVAAGFDGRGVKVGIIDLFDTTTLSAQIASGDVPPIAGSQRACFWNGATCPFGTPGFTHGNSVAEIVADGAPGATLFLVEVGSINDYLLAIDWLASKGVTIVNHSAGGAYDGAGDGTGAAASVIDYAVSKGIAWFNAAGNANKDPKYATFQGGYWRGTWADGNSNRWLNFSGTDESLTSYCGALLGLRWSDWGGARTDYDLYISDYNATTRGNGTKVLASGYNQGTGGSLPLEANDMRWLCNTNPAYGPVYDLNKDGYVSLWVYRTTRSTASPTGDTLEILVNSGWLEHSSSAGSISPFADSKNKGMASVGAYQAANIFTVAGYSSRGPTNDGRVKPDIATIGCLRTSVDGSSAYSCNTGGFSGTSAAAPVAVGIAAVGAGAFRLVKPADVVSWMRSVAVSLDATPSKDNNEGWGSPRLGVAPPTIPKGLGFRPRTATRILDTRGVNGAPRGSDIGVRDADSITTVWTGQPAGTTIVLNVALVKATTPGFLQVYPTGMAAPAATSNINVATAGGTRANLVVVTTANDGKISFYSSGGGHIIADLVGVFAVAQSSPLIWLSPYRAYESPSNTALADSTYVDVPLAGTSAAFDSNVGIPAITDAADRPAAAVIAVTVTNPTGRGFLSVVTPDLTTYATSNLNYEAGESITATAFVPLDTATGGMARVYVSKSARVRVDVLGYFAVNPHGLEGYFTGVSPTRVMDSRGGGKPAAGSHVEVPLAATFGVPAGDVSGVFVNTTSTGATGAGFLTTGAYADDEHYRTTSVPVAAQNIAASTVAQLTPAGALRVHTTVPSHLIADVSGWFSAKDPAFPPAAVTPVLEGDQQQAIVNRVAVSDDGGVVAYQQVSANASSVTVAVWRRANGTTTVVPGVGFAEQLLLSGDGSTLFVTTLSQPLPADTDSAPDIYSYRISDGQLALESTGSDAALDAVSDDATRIVLRTVEALAPADTDAISDTYLHHRTTGVDTLTSASLPAAWSATAATMNGAGTMVVSIASTAGGNAQLQVYDVATAVGNNRVYPIPAAALVDISDDGGTLLFESTDQAFRLTVSSGATRTLPEPSGNDYGDMFFRSSIDGTGTLLAAVRHYSPYLGFEQMPEPIGVLLYDDTTGAVQSLHRTWNGDAPSGSAARSVVSDDGHALVIVTFASNLTATAPGGEPGAQIYVIDLTAI